MLTFGVAPGSAAAADADATVDEDDQDDEAVLVAEQQKQQKERTQPVLFMDEGPKDVGIGKVSCVFQGTMKIKDVPSSSLTQSLSLFPPRSLSFFCYLFFLISLD